VRTTCPPSDNMRVSNPSHNQKALPRCAPPGTPDLGSPAVAGIRDYRLRTGCFSLEIPRCLLIATYAAWTACFGVFVKVVMQR
jgi:hypothetical protein